MSEWHKTTLGAITAMIKRGKAPLYVDEGLRVINQKCVRPGNRVDLSLARFTDAARRPVPDFALIQEGDVLVNSTGRGTLGRASQAPAEAVGGTVDSHVSLVRGDKSSVATGFLGVLLSDRVGDLESLQSGSTSQTELSVSALASLPVALPPLAEQRRIVDVVASVDHQIMALEVEVALGRGSVGPLIEFLLGSDNEASATSLGDMGEFIRGKRFTKADYTEDEGLGVIHYSHIHTHLGPISKQTVSRVPESMRSRLRLASKGDVVIAATSEDLPGVGKATVWLGDDDVAVHDDAQIFRHRLDPRFASFVFLSPAFQTQKVKFAGGTKVTRISGADLARIVIPIPPRDVQERIGEALSEVVKQSDCLGIELASLRAFRATLLSALLSQSISIPESYDALFDADPSTLEGAPA